jgi:hypothetical protein
MLVRLRVLSSLIVPCCRVVDTRIRVRGSLAGTSPGLPRRRLDSSLYLAISRPVLPSFCFAGFAGSSCWTSTPCGPSPPWILVSWPVSPVGELRLRLLVEIRRGLPGLYRVATSISLSTSYARPSSGLFEDWRYPGFEGPLSARLPSRRSAACREIFSS